MPLWSWPSSSSCSERIIPRETSPRSFASSSFVPPGSTAPGSATATVAPSPKFHAPQTICRELPLPHVDAAELEPVRVRMLPGLDDAADEIVVGVPVRVRDPATKDVLHHRGRDREALRELVGRDVELDVLAQPVERDAHQNCSRSRRSFCQSMRMSVRPWRSMKIRSRPQPKAKPETSSGS